MRDEHTAAIFAELRRIGVEPDLVGAPLIVTGFTARALRTWLEQVPTAAGGQELDARLEAHALAALSRAERAGALLEHDAERADPTPNRGQVRWWPTTLMLDAGIEVLAEEWDPVGVRLGGVPSEDIGEYALLLFGPLLHRWPGGDALASVTEMIGAIEESELGLRPSPLVHRRYLAARLREIVARQPLPVREPRPSGSAASATLSGWDVAPPPLDAEGVCSRCHKFGTVARVTTRSESPRTVRFCGACWREVRTQYMSTEPPAPLTEDERIATPDGHGVPASTAESRSWDDAVEFLRLVLTARNDPGRDVEITDAMLAELASEIAADADKMDGPMPEEVERFVRTYAGSV